jgi:DNA-binding GntR family transcriptional regulator
LGQLSEEQGVATATVTKALRILKREGLVIGSTGHGTFVAEKLS